MSQTGARDRRDETRWRERHRNVGEMHTNMGMGRDPRAESQEARILKEFPSHADL